MRQTTDELYKELTDRLKHVIKDIGYDLPPDKIPDTTKSLINLFITYEKYKDSIISKVSKDLENTLLVLTKISPLFADDLQLIFTW